MAETKFKYQSLTEQLENVSLKRQFITNGGFEICQRQANSTGATGTTVYVFDRWNVYSGNAQAQFNIGQTNVLPYLYRCMRVQRTAASVDTNALSWHYSAETDDSRLMRGEYLTLSFYLRKGANFSGTKVSATIVTGTGTNEHVLTGFTNNTVLITEDVMAADLSTNWKRFSVTTPAVIDTAVTQLGFNFVFVPVGTAGAEDWVDVTGIQVNAGKDTLPFVTRGFGQELALCQRYYEKSYNYADGAGTVTTTGATFFKSPGTTNYAQCGTTYFKQNKRPGTVTVSLISPATGTFNKIRSYATNTDLDGVLSATAGESSFTANISNTATGADQLLGFHWIAVAEL
jgi:hypothetical protein